MATRATHGLTFRLPAARTDATRSRHDRLFETWRASIWTTGVISVVTLATTALNVVPGPVDEIVMATTATMTGVLGYMAPLPD